MKPNKNVTLVGSSLPRNPAPPLPQLRPGMTPTMFRLLQDLDKLRVQQAKAVAKDAEIRQRFLLTNPERESFRKKQPGLIRLHQCAPREIGKQRRCDCEYITKSNAEFLEQHGQATWLESNSHIRLHLTHEEFDRLISHASSTAPRS